MAKYSDEFKLQVVKEYLTGKIGLTRLAEKYSIPSNTAIRTWVAAYKAYGKLLWLTQTRNVLRGRISLL